MTKDGTRYLVMQLILRIGARGQCGTTRVDYLCSGLRGHLWCRHCAAGFGAGESRGPSAGGHGDGLISRCAFQPSELGKIALIIMLAWS
jgi:hypothetical protein